MVGACERTKRMRDDQSDESYDSADGYGSCNQHRRSEKEHQTYSAYIDAQCLGFGLSCRYDVHFSCVDQDERSTNYEADEHHQIVVPSATIEASEHPEHYRCHGIGIGEELDHRGQTREHGADGHSCEEQQSGLHSAVLAICQHIRQ